MNRCMFAINCTVPTIFSFGVFFLGLVEISYQVLALYV